jgi:ATP synthase protein I
MTTTARPATGPTPRGTSQVLVAAGLCVAAAVALTTLAGGLVAGSTGALGALAGGSMALCFFLFGSLVVETATRVAPRTAIVVALMTYTLQVALVALIFVVLTSSGAVGSTLSAGWLAGGVIVATVAWTVGQLVASARARVLAYDIELPGGQSRASSRPREVGAP